MKSVLAVLVAVLSPAGAGSGNPLETQAQVEARTGARFCNGAETSKYRTAGYFMGDLIAWVLYYDGISEGELYARSGPMPDMEVAGFLEANKGASSWQIEKVEGEGRKVSAKLWSRKDGKLYAVFGVAGGQTIFMIGTKRAERLMADAGKRESLFRARDRIQ